MLKCEFDLCMPRLSKCAYVPLHHVHSGGNNMCIPVVLLVLEHIQCSFIDMLMVL